MAKKNNTSEASQTNAGITAEAEVPQAAGQSVDETGAEVKAPEADTARAAGDAAESSAAEAPAEVAQGKPATRGKASGAVVKVGKSLLKSNPEMSVVYMTADGLGFYERNDADNHARTLKDKAVTPVKR